MNDTQVRKWRVPRAVLDDLFKEKDMDAKTNPTETAADHRARATQNLAVGGSPGQTRERAKFVALAQRRMNRAIKAIRLVGQLERRPRDLDPTDISVMANALDAEVDDVRNRLIAAWKGEPDFQLGGEGE